MSEEIRRLIEERDSLGVRSWLDIKRTREADPVWLHHNHRSLGANRQVRIGRAKMHQALKELEKAQRRVQANRKMTGLFQAVQKIGKQALLRLDKFFGGRSTRRGV
jgi:hypothetical protein